MTTAAIERKLPVGAEVLPSGGVHFRVWAPATSTLSVELYSPDGDVERSVPLEQEAGGYFAGVVAEAGAGTLYKFRLEAGSYPDPASRFQPQGPHGPSEVIDPDAFRWTDGSWRGRAAREIVGYEMHLGTFTREGTWHAAQAQLEALRELGITMIEIMPIADFAGEFGWGYDGVDLFAPSRLYGRPEELKAFINRAHELGLMVILDVVYNHLGPDGNFLRQFSPDYFSTRHRCEWGEALNFDGPNAEGTREFFVSNARYWIGEYHFDGLRLDATQQIFDDSNQHILQRISRAARAAAPDRRIYLVAENEPQDATLLRSYDDGGYGLDAVWNDDFHHTAMVAATGRAEAYYLDYRGTAQEFVSTLKYGFLYQGQWYRWQKRRRGTPALDLPPSSFVLFLQNHDQVANSLRGQRLHELTSPGELRALTAVLLLSRGTPMLFQGQEFAATTRFAYFADHNPELRKLVREGRQKFLHQFRSIACAECTAELAEPGDRATFESSKLDFADRERNRPTYHLHADLLRLRREDPTIATPARIDGAVLSERAFVIRYFATTDAQDRLLLVNLGPDLHLPSVAEPLLAPVRRGGWKIAWSSESPEYGGNGTPDLETTAGWILPARSAVLLEPYERSELPNAKLSEVD